MICESFWECVNSLSTSTDNSHPSGSKKKKERQKRYRVPAVKGSAPAISSSVCKSSSETECFLYWDRRSQARCEERGQEYILNNSQANQELLCAHIDGGVVDSLEHKKCDYLLLTRSGGASKGWNRAFFVELKGKHTKEALQQLRSTLNLPPFRAMQEKSSGLKIYGRIACTRTTPNIQSTDDYLDTQERFLQLGGNLKIRNAPFHESFDEVDKL